MKSNIHVGFVALLFAVSGALGGCALESDVTGEPSTIQQSLSSGPTFQFIKVSDWGTGFNARIDLTNNGVDPISNWIARFDMPVNVSVNLSLPTNQWSVLFTPGIDNEVRIAIPDRTLQPGETLSVYMNGTYEGEFGNPVSCRFPNGDDATSSTPCDGSEDVTPPDFNATVGFLQSGLKTGFFFGPGSDDTGITGYLLRYKAAAPASNWQEIGEIHSTFAEVSRLASHLPNSFFSGRYLFEIVARDAAGNVSAPIETAITEVPRPPIEGSFAMTNQWPGGFQGAFTITNPTNVAIEDWHAAFTFDGTINSAWNGILTGSAPSFSLSGPDYDRRLDPGESVTVGVVGALSSTNTEPTDFTFSMGRSGVRPLAVSHPNTCASTPCPSVTHCVVQSNGYPTCAYGPPTS